MRRSREMGKDVGICVERMTRGSEDMERLGNRRLGDEMSRKGGGGTEERRDGEEGQAEGLPTRITPSKVSLCLLPQLRTTFPCGYKDDI